MKTLVMKKKQIIEQVWEEDRIFLFIDLNNSSHLAEKLGNRSFSYLITQCIADIYPLIHKYKAQLYQIVGDEIVLSWTKSDCPITTPVAQLFFDFEKHLKKSAQKYQKYFGTIPTFKATAHLGKVAVSINHLVPDEPIYRGDVLNTCGGLFELCKTLDKSLVVTENFINHLDVPNDFQVEPLGRFLIKGKANFENVYSLKSSCR